MSRKRDLRKMHLSVQAATEDLEGKVKEIDRATGWVYHETLYQVLDALEQTTEFLVEELYR